MPEIIGKDKDLNKKISAVRNYSTNLFNSFVSLCVAVKVTDLLFVGCPNSLNNR